MGRNLYSGKPWSEMDITDVERLVGMGVPIEEIADLFLRDLEEVRDKVASLKFSREPTTQSSPGG
jgi:hypothetical protein